MTAADMVLLRNPDTEPGLPYAWLDRTVFTDLARVMSRPGYGRWAQMVRRTGGCARPVHLVGERVVVHTGTGEVAASYSTVDEPGGRLLVACKDRRASRCPACSSTYRADTYHLIRAGLVGGDKGVPESVRAHPRVFATFTAPSFGPVHSRRVARDGAPRRCHPRRHVGSGESAPSCIAVHQPGDSLLGQPLDPSSFDYPGAVLWNNHAGLLWTRLATLVTRHLAAAAGLSPAGFRRVARLSFAKVAEWQTRGLVHFHAVIRLDGPDGQDTPPSWATADLLDRCLRSAAAAVTVKTTAPHARVLRWGGQLDIRPIGPGAPGTLSEDAVAGYVAKYATKGTETVGGIDRPIRKPDDLLYLPEAANDHVRTLVRTAWQLGNTPEYAARCLRKWAHTLGYRGHFSTKSRRYSTTLTALRTARADYRRPELPAPADPAAQSAVNPTLTDPAPTDPTPDSVHCGLSTVVNDWHCAGLGLSPGEAVLAAGIREEIETDRAERRALRATEPVTVQPAADPAA